MARRGIARLLRLGRTLVARAAVPAPRRRRRKPSSRPRDSQRLKVYRWEGQHVLPKAATPLSLAECRALVDAAYRWRERPTPDMLAGWSPPLVTDGRGRRHACGSRQVIKLPRWARTPAVVLHECAHGMAADLHGPEFVAVYVALLGQFAGLDEADLRATLADARVKVAPPQQADGPALGLMMAAAKDGGGLSRQGPPGDGARQPPARTARPRCRAP